MEYEGKVKYYFLEQDFGEFRTGVESSALLRARIFKKYLAINPILLTVTYNTGLNTQRRNLYEKNLLDYDCQIINMYEYFQETETNNTELQIGTPKNNNKWIYRTVANTNDYRVYDKNNNQIMYQACDDNGLLMYNNIYANKKKVRKDSYDSNGVLSRSRFFDPKTGQVSSETYYRTDGSVCIYKHYEFENNKNELKGIHIIDKRGEIIEVLTSDTDLISYWIQQILEEETQNILIIDKERIYFPAVLKIKLPNVYKVCMIHNLHVQKDQDIFKGKLKHDYREIFNNITEPDAIVLLTNKQKKHIEERYGFHDNLFVIPHALGKECNKVDFEKRIPHNAIYLARYFEEKQHNKLIRSFNKVVQKYPDAKLSFYGFGEPEQVNPIKRQIKELNLEKNIFVNDFVDDVDKIYDSASLSVLTSRMEGFSLFILESINHGCPVVSYDVNYGPSDMIDNGVNGYITEMNNEDEMAQRIIELFDDKEKSKAMSEAAYIKAGSFKSEIIAKMWLNLIEKVLQRKSSQS